MTNDEFLGRVGQGLDIGGQRVTARLVHPPIPLPLLIQIPRGTMLQPVFAIRINHGEELALWFDGTEPFADRMLMLDSLVERWQRARGPVHPQRSSGSYRRVG